jgi:hypothetical protein
MITRTVSTLICFVLFAQIAQAQNLSEALAGKTLTSEKNSLLLSKDGRLTGVLGKDKLVGAWTIRDGKFCRTISEPVRHAGTACQSVKIDGKVVTFMRADGTPQAWSME